MNQKSHQIVEHLFRQEYGKLVSLLTRYFGASHIQLSEDVAQETLIAALEHWNSKEIPENPEGWLFQVAKRKALNELKREGLLEKHHINIGSWLTETTDEMTVFLPEEIKDSQLRMIFTCCHPSLDQKSQIVLILKTLCGFGTKEVARALLSNEEAVNKRLYRAKEKIRNSEIPFDIPQGTSLKKRMDTVTLTLYLLFNEGYYSTNDSSVIRKDLCLEAMRLNQLMLDHFEKNHQLCALLALMCFHTARFDARIDDHGAIVLFEDQDRSKWSKELIHKGMNYFRLSFGDERLSSYHIEARIAAEHCLSKSFNDTNWALISDQYRLLQQINNLPIIQLNLAIILSQLEGIEASLKELNNLSKNTELSEYHLLPLTQGIFSLKLENYSQAIVYFRKALELTKSGSDTSFIQHRIAFCEERLPE